MSLLTTLLPSRARNVAPENHHDTEFKPSVKPAYEISETADAWSVTVWLPGVNKDGLELTAEEGRLHIAGRRAWQQPEGWSTLHRETADAPYELVLTHENAINLEAVAAEIRDGVLRVSLPKQEALKPRKIAVT